MAIAVEIATRLAQIAFADAILLMLAAWYLTEVVSNKTGPFKVFYYARTRLNHGGLLTCGYCLIVWITPLLLIVYVYLPCLIWPFALAGGALMLRAYTGVKHDG